MVAKVLEDPVPADSVDSVELNEQSQHDGELVPHVRGLVDFQVQVLSSENEDMRRCYKTVDESSLRVTLAIFVWAWVLVDRARSSIWDTHGEQHCKEHAKLNRSRAENHREAIDDGVGVNHI